MIWLVVVLVVVVVVLLAALWLGKPPSDSYRAAAEMHGIRRKFDVAEFKLEVRRDVAEMRRELRAELDGESEGP